MAKFAKVNRDVQVYISEVLDDEGEYPDEACDVHVRRKPKVRDKEDCDLADITRDAVEK